MVLIEQVVNGLVLGSMYALLALGYTLVFGVLDKLNFAHSEIFMLGGFIAASLLALGAPLWGAVICVVIITGTLGLVVELVSFRKFRSEDAQITAALSSLAVGLIIIDAVQKLWGSEPMALNLSSRVRSLGIELGGLRLTFINLAILGLTLALMAFLYVLVHRTSMGRNIRAVADSSTAAALLGINVKRVTQHTFFLASALAGITGVMLAVRSGFVTSDLGATFGLRALAVMAIGGMGDLRGAVVGGLLAGLAEAFAYEAGFGKLADMAVWLIMVGILLVKPSGLFGGLRSETRA